MLLREKVPRFLRNRPGKKNPFRGFPKTESADEGVGGARRGRKKSAEIRSSRGPAGDAWDMRGEVLPHTPLRPAKLVSFGGLVGHAAACPGARPSRGFEKSEKVRSTWRPLQIAKKFGDREGKHLRVSHVRAEKMKTSRRFFSAKNFSAGLIF